MEDRSFLSIFGNTIPEEKIYILCCQQFGDSFYANKNITPNTNPYQGPNGFQKGLGGIPRVFCRRDLGGPRRRQRNNNL